MAFRDDREALLAHIESLEQELQDVRRQLEEARAELEAKDRELEDVRSGREDARKRAERDRKRAALGTKVRSLKPILFVAGVAVAGGLIYFLSTQPERDFEVATERGVRPVGDVNVPAVPTIPPPPPAPTLDLVGAVAEASEGAPVQTGATCAVHAGPTGVGGCRATVRCADTELFAVDDRHGFVPCDRLSDQGPSTLDERTDDGDPMLTLDQTGGEVVVSNTAWQVRVAVAVIP